MKRKLLGTAAAAALALVLSAGSASAVPITSAGTIIASNGTTFSNFNCRITSGGNPATTITTPDVCSDIDVAVVDGNLSFTSGFTSAGLTPAFEDVLITYQVVNPFGIGAIDLAFSPVFFGLAVASVTEQVRTDSLFGTIVGSANVVCSSFGGCDLQDPPFEGPPDIPLNATYTQTLYVTKDINLSSGLVSGATNSFVGQSFTVVPEPISLALFGTGLLGLGLASRGRRRA